MQKIVGADLLNSKKSGKFWLVLDVVVPKEFTDDEHVGCTTNKIWVDVNDVARIMSLDLAEIKLCDLVDRLIDTSYSLNSFGNAVLSKITFYEEGGNL